MHAGRDQSFSETARKESEQRTMSEVSDEDKRNVIQLAEEMVKPHMEQYVVLYRIELMEGMIHHMIGLMVSFAICTPHDP